MLISLSGYLRLGIDLRCHRRSSVLDVTLGTRNESRYDLECLVTLFSPNSDLTYVEESMILIDGITSRLKLGRESQLLFPAVLG
jgi:hypothetical protein